MIRLTVAASVITIAVLFGACGGQSADPAATSVPSGGTAAPAASAAVNEPVTVHWVHAKT